MIAIHITVGGSTFTATLNNNETTQALVAKFPLTIQMDELNGLEKYNDLAEDLPAAATERPATIQAGDIMCWSGNTLVLFYQTFSNSYGGMYRSEELTILQIWQLRSVQEMCKLPGRLPSKPASLF